MHIETRFRRPPDGVLDTLVAEGFAAVGLPTTPTDATLVESGSNTLVALAGDCALRISRQPSGAAEMRRAQALIDALPGLPFAVPHSIGNPVTIGGYLAIPTRRITGDPHPVNEGDPDTLRDLLAAVHSIDPEPVREHLAEPRSFMGGIRWQSVLRDQVVPLLSQHARDEAERRIDALAALDPVPPVVNHGDLAGWNVLWHDGQVSGVLDWDLASLDDPAEDLSSLAAWHGWAIATELADAATVARAKVFGGSGPLQVIAFTLLNRRPGDELARAVTRAEERLTTSG